MSSSFSFRPPPSGSRGPANLAEFIARVNSQPGGFRSIDQDELRRQIEEKKNATANEDAEVRDGSENEEEAPMDVIGARNEILKNIE